MKILIYTREKKELSKDLQDYLVGNFDGLYVECVAPESIKLSKRFGLSECMLDTGTSKYMEAVKLNPKIINKYIDEPITSTDYDKWNVFEVEQQIDLYDYNLTIGELSSKAFDELEIYTCNVTYTAYRRYIKWIEKLFGWRIYIPCSSPLTHWVDLDNQFEHRFDMVWVHLTKNLKDMDELINWAEANGKEVWLYAGIGTWEDEKELTKYLDKWIKEK